MTVRNLIKQLQKLPEHYTVLFSNDNDDEGKAYEITYTDVVELESEISGEKIKSVVLFTSNIIG